MPDQEALTIRLFGPFAVLRDGEPLTRVRFRRGHELLALLVLRHGRAVERSWLAATLWPDLSEPRAYAGLRSSLYDLRLALGPDARRLQSPTSHTLAFDLADVDVDALAFDRAISRGDPPSLEEAVTLYRGPLLEDCAEAWAFSERLTREQAVLEALETLASEATARGETAAAERYLRRAIAIDPVRETAHRALMHLLAGMSNYAAVNECYRKLRERLHREQHSDPDPETQALFRRLRHEAREKAARGSRLAARSEGQRQLARADDRPSAGQEPRTASREPPGGTVTFLFTDIEGSTRLWEAEPEAMPAALARHDALLRQIIESCGGYVFKTIGDQFCAAFATAPDALAAATAGQRALVVVPDPSSLTLRVRMALHTGTAEEREGDYFGPPLNRIARLLHAGHGGQILLSLATEELIRDHLPEGVGLRDLGEHRLRDLTRPERIWQVTAADLPADFPPLDTLERRLNNLPAQATPLVGRQEELTALQQILRREEVRLVTLTGPGGTGKTRLALQVAAELLDAFPDGVYFVNLSPIRDPTLVTSTIAQSFGVREGQEGTLQERLQQHLQSKRVLLLLDNFEQILEAASRLSELLAGAPRLKLLVTSRALLHLRGEHEFPVSPLPTPPMTTSLRSAVPPSAPKRGRDPSPVGARETSPSPVSADLARTLTQYASVELFIQRAAAAKPEFAVTNENAPAVAEICHRLDGLPLAIELAAARIRLLPPQSLLSRLGNRLQLLTGGPRDAPARQQTLRDTISWSYDLLDESEQRLFQRLSVFVGGFTLEAAEAVCGGALDSLASLLDQSLLRQEEAGRGEPRFGMLETIQEYALDRLQECGELATIQERHAAFFRAFAESGVDYDRLEGEHDNLRAALIWLRKCGATELALRLGAAVWHFWLMRDHLVEGRAQVAALLALPGAEAFGELRAEVLYGAGLLAIFRGEYPQAQKYYEEFLAIERALGSPHGIAAALIKLGEVATAREEYAAAHAFLEEGLSIYRTLEEPAWVAGVLGRLGEVARGERNYRRAAELYDEALALVGERDAHPQIELAMGLHNRGHTAVALGDIEESRAFFAESLSLWGELRTDWGQAGCLIGLAGIDGAEGRAEKAARLLGAAISSLEKIGCQLQTVDQAAYERYLAVIRAQLDEATFTAAWAEGQEMTLEAALAQAMENQETA